MSETAIENLDDRREFFTDHAVPCELSGPDAFAATIPVLLNALTENVVVYEINIEAAAEHFLCLREDFAGVDRQRLKQYQATIDATTYRIERASNDQDGKIVTVYLKK